MAEMKRYDSGPLWLPAGFTSRGADLGRIPENTDRYDGRRMRLQRMPFSQGGYDRWGAYWGLPADLWIAWCAAGDGPASGMVRVYVRARSREEAKTYVQMSIDTPHEIRFYK